MKNRILYGLAAVAVCFLGSTVYLMVTSRQAFYSGLNAGIIDMQQSQVVSSFFALELLEKVRDADAERCKKFLIGNMNSSLSVMTFGLKDVKVRPVSWKILVRMNNATYKGFYKKLRDQRAIHHWESIDPVMEKKIQAVIDQWIQSGNLYGV